MLIITNSGKIKDEHLEIAKKNNINIINTGLDTFNVAKKIGLCNYISTILTTVNPISFEYTDFLNKFLEISSFLTVFFDIFSLFHAIKTKTGGKYKVLPPFLSYVI